MDKMEHIKNHFENEAQIYDEVILKLIPYYKEMVSAIVGTIPFKKTDALKVLDLGCGTGTISLEIKNNFPNATFTLVDLSPKMLEIAKNKINNLDTQIHNVDFYKYNIECNYDVIISSLALHHLVTDNDKKTFYLKIYKGLSDNGLFFNADVVLSSKNHLQGLYIKKWVEYMSKSCELDEIINKWLVTYKNEDNPAVLLEQIKWLEEIGFKNVDIVWKYYNFAVYGGYKN
jgi:tRNA (cmo5U34)-methyltransferase